MCLVLGLMLLSGTSLCCRLDMAVACIFVIRAATLLASCVIPHRDYYQLSCLQDLNSIILTIRRSCKRTCTSQHRGGLYYEHVGPLGVAGVASSKLVVMAAFGSIYNLEHRVQHISVSFKPRKTLEVLQLLKGLTKFEIIRQISLSGFHAQTHHS